jgi:hypothetical protein
MISPPAIVLRDHHTGAPIEFLIPRTDASIIKQLTILACRLHAVIASESLSALSPPKSQLHVLGGIT